MEKKQITPEIEGSIKSAMDESAPYTCMKPRSQKGDKRSQVHASTLDGPSIRMQRLQQKGHHSNRSPLLSLILLLPSIP